MKGYKAFESGMICRGKQYAENTVFEEPEAAICKKGMHFCEDPLDCLKYYPLVGESGKIPEFAEVEALDDPITDDGEKFCTKKLKIGAKIGLDGVINAHIGLVFERCKDEKTEKSESGAAAASGLRGAAVASGESGAAVASGLSGAAVASGLSGAAAASGLSGAAAASGESGAAVASGLSGAAVASGLSGAAVASGESGAAVASGLSGAAAVTGEHGRASALGYQCIAVAWGEDSAAMGTIGNWIVLSERDDKGSVINAVIAKVDGEKIMPETFYKLVNGEIVEA